MREIKFRAWNRIDKRVIDNFIIYRGNVYEDYRDFEDGIASLDIDLIQFTGLLDKNGKEIYEGDILRFALSIGAKAICKDYIEYNEKKAWFNLGRRGYCLQAIYEPEIIGNTYESPDLIK